MENVLGITFILFSICALVITFIRTDSNFIGFWIGGTSAFAISLFVILIIYDCTPTAMDVYKGKTTLEYTVVDGVKVDSTVVWETRRNNYDLY